VSRADYNAGVIDGVTVTNAAVTGKDLILIAAAGDTYTVSGTVTTSNTASAEGAAVRVKKNGTPVGAPAYAGAGGAYTTPALPAGEYAVEISLEGYTTGTINVTITAAGLAGQDLLLQIKKYSVSFIVNGGSPAPQTQNIDHGSLVTKPADPDKTGYTFGGWYREAAFTTPWNFASDTVTSGRALYAKWTAVSYPITYHLDGGTNGANPASYTVENLPLTLAVPTRSGYDFGGWYTDGEFTGQPVAAIPAGSTGARAFYARWTTGENARTQLLAAITAATTAKNSVTVNAAWTEGQLYAPGAYFATAAASLPRGLYSLNPDPVPAYAIAITAATNVYIDAGATAANLVAAKAALETAGGDFTAALAARTEGTLGLAARIAGAASTDQTVYLYADETFQSVSSANITKTLALKGVGEERTVQLTSDWYMFYLSYTGNLTLDENVTLKGTTSNTVPLVYVYSGTLLMKGNARITGNGNGGGVEVNGISGGPSGTFTMQDHAAVSGNTGRGVNIQYSNYGPSGTFIMEDYATVSGNGGGGVRVQGKSGDLATFTMRGHASVSGNPSSSYGGGVYLVAYATFTMQDSAEVSNNTANGMGGGVCDDGGSSTFTMEGSATISDNTVNEGNGGGVFVRGTFTMRDYATISDNTANGDDYYSETGNGGGVYIQVGGTFTMEGSAVISGNAANGFTSQSGYGGGVYGNWGNSGSATFIKKGGTIYGSTDTNPDNANTASPGYGHAVGFYSNNKRRDTTAGPLVNLYAKNTGSWTYVDPSYNGAGDTTANWE
jgi:uncharacterized repeat protein (TIGR02543 family)